MGEYAFMQFIQIEFSEKTIDNKKNNVLIHDHVLLRNRRIELGLTQQQVADKANIQLRQYQRVESGERHIRSASAKTMLSICAVLKIDPYEFFPNFKDMGK